MVWSHMTGWPHRDTRAYDCSDSHGSSMTWRNVGHLSQHATPNIALAADT